MRKVLVILFLLISAQVTYAQETKSQNSAIDIAKNGTYFDGLLALGSLNLHYDGESSSWENNGGLFGFGMRLGTVRYWNKNSKPKIGLNIIYASATFMTGEEVFIQILPLNLGLSTIWKLSETKAMEVNINAGYTLNFAFLLMQHGFNINPEVKFRLTRTLLGIGYQFSKAVDSYNTVVTHQIVLSVGVLKK